MDYCDIEWFALEMNRDRSVLFEIATSTLMAEKSYPSRRPGAVARGSYPTPEARGSGWEEQPHFQGAVAVRVQEGLEELFHVEGQEGWW